MIICMPTIENSGMGSKVYGHFGSAPFFAIYNTEEDKLDYIDNSNQHHAHGTCNPIGQIAGLGVDLVITGGMGRRAIAKLNDGGIKVFRLDGETVKDAIQNMMDGRLEEMTPDQACAGHGCH